MYLRRRPDGSAASLRDGSTASRVSERLSVCLSAPAHNPLEHATVAARLNLTQALAEAARSLDQPAALQRTLQDVADAAVRSVPDFDHASITLLHPDGRFETSASTGSLASGLDSVQYDSAEGPCLDTV